MKKAFTLVELLVVIAIIGILASMLLPVLTTIRERGNQIKCKGNLSQLGKGIQVYFNHDGWGRGRLYPANNGGGFLTALYHADLLGEREIYQCPSDPNPDEVNPSGLTAAETSDENKVSYAGRKNLPQTKYPGLWQWFKDTTGTTVASDDFDAAPNHESGDLTNFCYLDSHVDSVTAKNAGAADDGGYSTAWSLGSNTTTRGRANPLTN